MSSEVRGISPEEWMRVWHVYDAAMAAHEARGKCDTLANKLSPEHERITAEELAEKAEVALYLACRRAKEGV